MSNHPTDEVDQNARSTAQDPEASTDSTAASAFEQRRARFNERYAAGQVPWDDELPPPEILALAAELPPGRAVDLGCGYGRAAIHLAEHGWQVDAVDYIDAALIEGHRRAVDTGVPMAVHFRRGDVTRLKELGLDGPYDLAVDVGCLHGLDDQALERMRDELVRVIRPGGIFQLFAHLRLPVESTEDPMAPSSAESCSPSPPGPRWLDESLLLHLFGQGFTLEATDYGTTVAGDRGEVPSAWYRFRRLG